MAQEIKLTRFVVTCRRKDRDRILVLRSAQSKDSPATLDLRIFGYGTKKARLRAAFGSQVLPVTLKDDVQYIEASVEGACKTLNEAGLASQVPKIIELWDREYARLKAIWAESEKNGLAVHRLVLTRSTEGRCPALAFQNTALSEELPRARKGDIWGVGLNPDFTTFDINGAARASIEPMNVNLMVHGLFNSTRRGANLYVSDEGKTLTVLRKRFDEIRAQRDLGLLRPLDLEGAVARDDNIYFENGWSGRFSVQSFENRKLLFSARLEDDDRGIWLDASDAGNLRFSRNVGGDDRFKSKDTLDAWVRPLIRMIVAFDADLSAEVSSECSPKWLEGDFDPKHPILKGLKVPARQRPLIGAILDKPYTKAVVSAEARSARMREKNANSKSPPKE